MDNRSAKPLVKIGGSLVYQRDGETLKELLAVLGKAVRETPLRLALVPGGGPFADGVRYWSAVLGLGQEAAHFMALKAMDQYGYVLHHFLPGSRVLEMSGLRRPGQAFPPGVPTVLLCASFMRKVPPEELPRSWEATSDSVAAYLARRLGADRLVLVKPGCPSAIPPAELVDPCFPELVPPGTDAWVVQGTDPELVLRAVLGQAEEGRGAVRCPPGGRGVAW